MNERRFITFRPAVGFLLVVFLAIAVLMTACSSPDSVVDSDILIESESVTSQATFYAASVEGVDMEVIAVRAEDGTVRTAFNTCQVCYDSGNGYYKQKDDYFECQNCKNLFHLNDIEVVRGGCNPVPIDANDKNVSEGLITISKETLARYTYLFSS